MEGTTEFSSYEAYVEEEFPNFDELPTLKESTEKHLRKQAKQVEAMIKRDSIEIYDNPVLYISEEEAMLEAMK